MDFDKKAVHNFWQSAACGENLYLLEKTQKEFLKQAEVRYQLEPYIENFANFNSSTSKKVLEIGVGLGADHQRFAQAGAILSGIDLTNRAIEITTRRLQILNLESSLQVGDAENLPFENSFFDIVYSWGCLHHTPDTKKAINEIFRVLKPGGISKVMIYNKYSIVGYMLWMRYALFKFKPNLSLESIYNKYLESPGTKAYSIDEAKQLFSKFKDVDIKIVLTHADFLTSQVGQQHRGLILSLAKLLLPRWLIRKFMPNHGLFMLITATK